MSPHDVLQLVTPQATRAAVADAYGELLAEHCRELGALSVADLNHAIIARWSMSGLIWIKKRAWKYAATQIVKRQRATPYE